ncbi:hypothetical protein SOVF_111100 [Spinacia oleracea]|nr:hypothetical protein SOVF_111100 [Spinacia oleracea]
MERLAILAIFLLITTFADGYRIVPIFGRKGTDITEISKMEVLDELMMEEMMKERVHHYISPEVVREQVAGSGGAIIQGVVARAPSSQSL